MNHTPLGFLIISWITAGYGGGGGLAEQGHTIMALLAVKIYLITEICNGLVGKLLITDFGFLQTDNIR